MGCRVWTKHEEKNRRHQPGGSNENKGKVCRYCDVRPQRDLTIARLALSLSDKASPFPISRAKGSDGPLRRSVSLSLARVPPYGVCRSIEGI
jgi:hypothetical protein